MKPEGLDELLLAVREVFDYVEGVASDYEGTVILYLDYELMVVALPAPLVNDYLEVVASLADEVRECRRGGYNLYYSVDPEAETKVVVRVKPIHRYRGRVYLGFRVLGVKCRGCRLRDRC